MQMDMQIDIQKLCDDFRATGGLTGIKTTPPAKTVVKGERTAAKCSHPKKTKEEHKQYEKEKRKNPTVKHELYLKLRKRGLATVSELDKHLILFDSLQERPPTDKVQKATQPDVNLERVIELAGWLKAATDDVKVKKELLQVQRKALKEPTERLDILRKVKKLHPKPTCN